MPGINKTGGRWNEREKADLVGQVVTGALSVREACARHNLSHERIRDWVAAYRRSAVEAFDEHLRQTLASQGIDAGEISAPGFTGSLGDIAITDLIQTLGLSRRDAVITISHDGRETRIWCAAGEIVDAESGKLKGVPALHRALALEHGRVVAEFSAAQRNRTIHTATLPLLLDAARRIDECRVLMQRLGSARYVLAPKVMSAEAAFSAGEAAVLHCFHAPSLVSDALAESEIGDLETLKTISRLVERGYLSSEAEVESSILRIAPLAGCCFDTTRGDELLYSRTASARATVIGITSRLSGFDRGARCARLQLVALAERPLRVLERGSPDAPFVAHGRSVREPFAVQRGPRGAQRERDHPNAVVSPRKHPGDPPWSGGQRVSGRGDVSCGARFVRIAGRSLAA